MEENVTENKPVEIFETREREKKKLRDSICVCAYARVPQGNPLCKSSRGDYHEISKRIELKKLMNLKE